jgi:hypothetical protein
MAKTSMLCPFSGTLCKDCPVYRGRHYFLCYCEKYRGCLPQALKDLPLAKKNSNGKFKMPSFPNRTKDPYNDLMLPDVIE